MTPIQVMEAIGIQIDDKVKENELLNQYFVSSKYRAIDQVFEKEAGIIGDLEALKQEVEDAIKATKGGK